MWICVGIGNAKQLAEKVGFSVFAKFDWFYSVGKLDEWGMHFLLNTL
jgi:hypothetical protein